MLVGLLKTLSCNKQLPLPIKLYEIADVILKDSTSDVGAVNQRRLAMLYCDVTASFEKLHGVVDTLMLKLGVSDERYYLDPSCDDEALFPGMRANVIVDEKSIGVVGILHPQVVSNFNIGFPATVCEINIEGFV